jgi:hypothetical protein
MKKYTLFFAILPLVACSEPGPCTFPDPAVETGGVLGNEDTCGFWQVPVGEHLYLDLHVTRELPDCAAAVGDGLSLPNDPIYTNLAPDGPKYTYDIVADSAVAETNIDITCDEATEWHALVTVE